jgi:hypothetical protein
LTFWLFEDIGFKMTISLDDQIWTRENPKNVKLQNKLFWKGSWCWFFIYKCHYLLFRQQLRRAC